jgi:hypothetical protein
VTPEGIEKAGRLLELGFVFLLVPAVVSTMDRAPIFLGGRILLWAGLYALMGLQSGRDGGALAGRLRDLRKVGNWLPALALLLGIGTLLQILLRHFGLWHPAAFAGPWGAPASLVFLLLLAVSTALPMEFLLRAYLPVRFPGWWAWLLGPLLTGWFYLGAWNVSTFALAVAGGSLLQAISRWKGPFWILPLLHALGAWGLICSNL